MAHGEGVADINNGCIRKSRNSFKQGLQGPNKPVIVTQICESGKSAAECLKCGSLYANVAVCGSMGHATDPTFSIQPSTLNIFCSPCHHRLKSTVSPPYHRPYHCLRKAPEQTIESLIHLGAVYLSMAACPPGCLDGVLVVSCSFV